MPINSSLRSSLARQAADLRDRGFTYDRIAVRLGVSPHQVRRLIRDGVAARMSTWMDRRFGVEIEHHGVAQSSSAQRMRELGLSAEAQDYNHRVQSQWKSITDASCGYEVVSPILSGENGFEQVALAMQAIREMGGSVSTRCGLHVHLDMSDLDGAAIARFVETYVDAQAQINAMMPPSRRVNGFCRPWDRYDLETVTRQLRSTRTVNYYERYRTINVCSFPKYGTIEVRQHQGTLNAAKIEAWIKLMMALVEIAKQDRCGEIVTCAGPQEWLDSVCSIVSMPAGIKRRLERRFQVTAGAR